MDELDNILSSPSENPVETEETNEDKATEEKEETDSNKLEVEDQENENSSDRQVDDDAQVPQDDEEQEDDKKDEEDQENAKDDEEEKDEESEGETKKKRKHKKKEKKSKKDKKDKRKKKKKDDEDENLKSKIFGDSDDEEDDDQEKDADFDTADVDVEEEGKRALEEIVSEKKKDKKKKRSRDEKKKSRSSKKRKDSDSESAPQEQTLPLSNEPNDFDLVIESLKKGHRRRKSDGPPEGADDFVRSFVHRMDIAAEEDIRANQQHLPALNKVKLLPEVGSQLAKKYLHDLFIGSGVLNTLKKWLDPLPDGSLPNIKVREIVIQGLLEMGSRVQTEDLRESGIGRAVMLLSKHPNETLLNKKNSKTLIELWSRPIFNLSSKYRDLHRSEDRFPVQEDNSSSSSSISTVKSVKATDLDHSSASPSAKNSKDSPSLHAKIPDKIALDFKVMPKANEEAARLLSQPKKGGDSKGLARKSPGNKNKIDRAVTMSIEGRGVYR